MRPFVARPLVVRSLVLSITACAPAWGCTLLRHTDDLSGGKRPDAGVDGSVDGTPVAIASGRHAPSAIATESGNVYWAEHGAIVVRSSDGKIANVVTLDGTSAQSLKISIPGNAVWASPDAAVVGSCALGANVNGCSFTKSGGGSPSESIVALGLEESSAPQDAVGYGTNFMWTNGTDDQGVVGLCGDTLPCTADNVVGLARHQNRPRGVAADDTNVYWVNAGDGSGNGEVNRIAQDADPTNGDRPDTLASNLPTPYALVLYGGRLYWTNEGGGDGGSVQSIPAAGGDVQTVASAQKGAHAIAVDASGIYWTTYGADGTICMCPLAGCDGGVHVLATSQANAAGIAVDSDSVYWTIDDDSAGAVMKIAKPR